MNKETNIKVGGDWTWLFIVILVVLCAGEPDVLDAVVGWISRQP